MGKRISLSDVEVQFLLRLCLREDRIRNTADASTVFAEESLDKLIQKLDSTVKEEG
jgi:hypothetical protein